MDKPVFKFPDAGDIRCYDKQGNEIPPPSSGDDLYGQNGCFVVNPMSFTKLDGAGNPLPDTATWADGYRVVEDNNTGLMWEIKSPQGKDINFTGRRYSWDDAKNYVDKLNKVGYGGFSDWRLPNKDELRSIIDYGRTNPAVDTFFFPNCQVGFYWTSVPYMMQPPFVWGIFFGLGSGIPYTPKSEQFVRAVRGGYNPDFGDPQKTNFQDNGDGTITDLRTGLMWQKDENERMDWYEALKYCKNMNLAGYNDWRLPNIKELNTILDLTYKDGWWYHKEYFPAEGLQPPLLHYFSSTPYEKTYVWVTNFCFGYDGYYASKSAKLLFRAVRNVNPPKQIKRVFVLPHTGQKKCYDFDGNIIKVPARGERFYGQDGSVEVAPLSFKKLREGGYPISDKAGWEDGARMVLDTNTGLVWELKSPHAGDFNFKGNRYNWEDAKKYIDYLNRISYAGFSDWRLPNREELRSIVDYSGLVPAVNPLYFPDTQPHFYWSKDTYAKDSSFVWGIYFAYGCAICYLNTTPYYVRAVRGGYNPDFGDTDRYAFKDNGDGTVTDLNTHLMWKKEESPDANWEEALKYCEELKLAGYNDWRLPTIKELATILDLSYKDGTWYHKEFFPDVKTLPLGFYWASTTYGDTFGWGVNFQFGYDGYYAGKKGGKYAFRPVRRI